jgi:predicted RecA/RadA family phage recombinase
MAKNRKRESGRRLSLPVPVGTLSGTPLVLGDLPCVAVVNRDEWTTGEASVQTDGTWSLAVKGVTTGGGNSAIGVGDILYLLSTGEVSKNSSGAGAKRFGYALEAVSSGATKTIEVKCGY